MDHEGVRWGLMAMYEARSGKSALEADLRWAKRRSGKYPRAVRSVERYLEESLDLFLCPAHHKVLYKGCEPY